MYGADKHTELSMHMLTHAHMHAHARTTHTHTQTQYNDKLQRKQNIVQERKSDYSILWVAFTSTITNTAKTKLCRNYIDIERMERWEVCLNEVGVQWLLAVYESKLVILREKKSTDSP